MKKEPNLSRRVLIYIVMAFCMTMLVWLAWYGRDNSDIHKLLVEGCFWTMGLFVIFYVLGANIDSLVAMLPFLRGGAMANQQQAPHVPLKRRRVDRGDDIQEPRRVGEGATGPI